MALLILALLQRIFLMSSLMLLLVWLIFFMVLIKLFPVVGTISERTVKLLGLAVVILALLQRIFLMSLLMLLLVWLIFFMVLIKVLPILGTISGKTVKLMVLALICLGNNRQDCHPPNCMFSCLQILEAFLWFRSEERFSRNAETDLVCRLLLEKKKSHRNETSRTSHGLGAS